MKNLRERFKEIEEDRAWCEYPLDGLLTLICVAMMCRCNHIREIERWGKTYRWELSERLGFRRNRMPCEKEFRDILKRLDAKVFTRIVAEWRSALAVFSTIGILLISLLTDRII